VRCKGRNQNGKWWRIAIDKPIEEVVEDRQIQAVIELRDKAMATSGNYRNFYVKDGRKYAHTINPKTGYPELNNVLSVSIIAEDCMSADAYATACMVMGYPAAYEFVKQDSLLEGYFIYTDGSGNLQVAYTNGIVLDDND